MFSKEKHEEQKQTIRVFNGHLLLSTDMLENERQHGIRPQAVGRFVGAPAAALVGTQLYQVTHLPSKVERQTSGMNIQPMYPTEWAPQPK